MNKNLWVIAFALFLIFYQDLSAQFGKNKVQYQNFEWQYIESRHFDVYFHDNTKYLAEYTAIKAEESLRSIQKTLNYRLTKRISLIVYNSHNEFQQTNVIQEFMSEGIGGVTELLKNRVVVPFQGDYDQFEHVIHHELTHAVINDMFYGGTFQSAMTSGSNIEFPLWMHEGLCEYESNNGLDAQTDMFIRDVSLSENLKGLEYLYGYYAYRGGQSFYWYVADKYGSEKVSELINRLRVLGSVDQTFKSTFKMNLEEFSEQWKKDMKKFYWPDVEKYEYPEDYAQRVTNHKKEESFYNTSPAISPDGEKVAFISDKDGVYSVYVKELNKKDKIEKLVSSFRRQDFEDLNLLTPGISWDPDGKRIIISAKSGGEDALFIVDARKGSYDKIKLGLKSISSVQWSPDGLSVAFIASSKEKSDVYLYVFQDKELINLTNDIFSDFYPVWTADSKQIYFISDRGEYTDLSGIPNIKIWNLNTKQSDIYRIDVKTKKIERITNDPEYYKSSIAIMTSKNKLYYVSDKNGIGNIYELDLNSHKTRPITNSLTGITQITLSPDGSKMLFSSLNGGGYDLFMLKNPSEIKLKSDTLQLTKFRENTLSKKKQLDEIKRIASVKPDTSKPIALVGYGNYALEFSRQQVIKPNPDAQQKLLSSANNDSQTDKIDSMFVAKNYKLKFSPDVILGNPSYSTYFGFQGIGQVLFSDVLGNHQILLQANLLVDLRNSTFYGSYWYMPNIIDYQIAVFHSAAFVYDYNDYLYRFRSWGGLVNASYPFDLFNRMEFGVNLLNVSKENIDVPTDPSVSRFLMVPQISYVHDDVLWGYYAPVQGTRYNFELKGVPKFTDNGIGFITATCDLRGYLDLIPNYLNIAVRGTAGGSFGPNPTRFFLGGTENWINSSFYNDVLPFDQPEDFAFMQFVMPLRGFDVNQHSGTRYFATNLELRFPLIRAMITGPIPILLHSIMGSVFLDVGGAWDGNFSNFRSSQIDEEGNIIPKDLLVSSGFGVRSYLLGIPVKFDVAWRNNFYKWSRPYYLFSLGYDF